MATQMRADGFVNMLNKYGTRQDNSTAYQWRNDGIVSDITITEHYETDGLFSKIIDIPAQECVKHGFNLGITSPEIVDYIDGKFDDLEIEDKLTTAIKWSRLYGGCLAVMLINDGGSLEEPLNLKYADKIEDILIFERPSVTPDFNSIYELTGKIGVPKSYQVTSLYGCFSVHESRCLVFRNGLLPERTFQAIYRFWGVPEYVKIKRELRENITSNAYAVKLLERSVQAVYKMAGLVQNVGIDGGEEQILTRLQHIDMARNILNTIAIDSQGEDFAFQQTTLSGLKEVIDTTCNALSAVTNIPQTILFGRSPSGMNATGQSDFENYYNYIEQLQKMFLRSNVRYFLDIILNIGVNTGVIKELPNVKLSFKPLWNMDEKQKSEVEKIKADTAKVKAETATIYVAMQALDPTEVRKALADEQAFNVEEILDNMEIDFSEELSSDTDTAQYNSDGWITINGTHVQTDKNGDLIGGVAQKITATSVPTNRKELEEIPIGTKLQDKYGYDYEKVAENKWKTKAGNGNEMFDNNNSMLNRGLEKYTISQSEQEKSSKSEEYNGETIEGIDKNVYTNKKRELSNNMGKPISDEKVKEMVDATNEYTGSDYLDILSASADFSGVYKDYSSIMSDSKKAKSKKKASEIEEMLTYSDKYTGTVNRALGFDLDGEYEQSAAYESLMSSLQQGKTVSFGALTSWTSDDKVLNSIFLNRTGMGDETSRTAEVTLSCKSKSGVDISQIADIKGQKEILFSKNAQYRVKSVAKTEVSGNFDTLRVNVELEEIYKANRDSVDDTESIEIICSLSGNEISKLQRKLRDKKT